MSYKVSKKEKADRRKIVVRTQPVNAVTQQLKWWKAKSKDERAMQAIATAVYIKEQQTSRVRQAALYARMYGNQPLWGAMGGSFDKFSSNQNYPTSDRPTFNLVQSVVDTLVSKMAISKPRPVFLTDNADYRQRNLAKQLNNFLSGELYQTEAFQLGKLALRDALVWGTGVLKVLEKNDRVHIERVMPVELLVDHNDGLYGQPQCLYQVALVDRDVLHEKFPDQGAKVEGAEQAFRGESDTKTATDQVLVVEAWHLPSGPDAGDGWHQIAVSTGSLFDEQWDRDHFPFVFLTPWPRLAGFFGQGSAERLMGTQIEVNKLLITISRSINLVGVPRVLVENSSKVVKAHINDQIGAILTYSGVKPEFINAMSNHPELYQQLQRLIEYGFQQEGVSMLSAASKKPDGLNSGVALREYDDQQSDRFTTLQQAWDTLFSDLGYLIIEKAQEIAERTGKYQTVYPNKDGTREIDLPAADLIEDAFVIQCFNTSSLPRDPAGRKAYVTEMLQAGMIDVKEARRLLDYPDLQQNEKLDNASEERILQILDEIVGDGKYTPPDPFMDLALADKLSMQYYNLYQPAKLEEERAQMLRTFNSQAKALVQGAMAAMAAQMAPPGAPGAPGPAQAAPEPLPTSPMLPR